MAVHWISSVLSKPYSIPWSEPEADHDECERHSVAPQPNVVPPSPDSSRDSKLELRPSAFGSTSYILRLFPGDDENRPGVPSTSPCESEPNEGPIDSIIEDIEGLRNGC